MKRLRNQIYDLEKWNQQLKAYLDHLNIYEYHIQRINIDKVKGTLQFGHLIEKNIQEANGIHRFFINEIKISEVEDSGTVGIGVAEKDKKKKKKKSQIPPEQATGEIKEIYVEIKQLLDIEDVPVFIQELAVNKEVLSKVWDTTKNHFDTSIQINLFYENAKTIKRNSI